jgi:hypothetical protein
VAIKVQARQKNTVYQASADAKLCAMHAGRVGT